MAEIKMFETGWTSRERQRNQRVCDRCGSTDIMFKDKFYAVCNSCGRLMPKRRKKASSIKITPLPLDQEDEVIKYEGRKAGIRRGARYTTFRNKLSYVRMYQGFGLTKTIFTYLKGKGVKEIVIIYTKVDGTQETYYSTSEDWENNSIEDNLGEFETQMFLPSRYFRRG